MPPALTQDSFIDDEDDTCPLCIEEFDLSDRNFKPCPCGYQICQFCFNNLKTNMNGLCPACRRPYDEKTIQWKVITPEEEAEFRANITKNQKKRASEQKQKEVQKREAEKENRKNLVGVRVVQKNLVYVTGLVPTVAEDELLKTLRKPEFFGQYGNIQKISISNRKSSDGHTPSLGVYVTFEGQEEAKACIQAVNGSVNADRVLRAQLGTTKYCSAWLRHEQCGNRQCMFLHELGDEEDSYSRQDLSSLNSVHTQRMAITNAGSSRSASRQQGAVAQPPSSSAVSQPMGRSSSKDESDSSDGPALPATANWAKTTQQRSRRGSYATSGAGPSPAISTSVPVTAPEASQASADTIPTTKSSSRKAEKQPISGGSSGTPSQQKSMAEPSLQQALMRMINQMPNGLFGIDWKDDSYPPLIDPYGGRRRRLAREEEGRLNDPEQQADTLEASDGEPESGSLALGGEPEDKDQNREPLGFDQRRNAGQPPIQRTNTEGIFSPSVGYGQGTSNIGSASGRAMTPQQFAGQQGSFVDQMPPGLQSQRSGLFQGQGGHSRSQSRYSFANSNDNSSATSTKLATDPRILAQQSNMMPSTFRQQPNSQFYASSMPGPPPGLKSTGTPPVTGMYLGQGQSFGFGGGSTAQDKNELLQSLIRGRGSSSAGQMHDKQREYFSSFHNQFPPSSSSSSTPAPAASGLLASFYGSQPGAFQDLGPKQKKKGKKHRHANTSSSGGSGLVNLADPSILRMQQQQQENPSGVGQGLFGGQTQDDDLLPLPDAQSASVDALVADNDQSTPDMPALLPSQTLHSPFTSLPPGLGLPHGHPPFSAIQDRVSTPTLQAPPGLGPNLNQAKSPSVSRPATPLFTPKGSVKTLATGGGSAGSSDAKQDIKDVAAKSGLAQDIAAQSSPSRASVKRGKQVLQEEDFPALDTVKLDSPPKGSMTPKIAQGITKPTQEKKGKSGSDRKTSTAPTTPVKSSKRPVPIALDIEAATKSTTQGATAKVGKEGDGAAKAMDEGDSGASLPSRSQAPSGAPTPTTTTASISSPIARGGPKTLRLVHTPRAETPPVVAPSTVTASIRASATGPSGNRPATPASEPISPNIPVQSVLSSTSRPSSPPPGKVGTPPSKVGTAAARATTKSQQRKQRKEASKEAASQIAETRQPEVEVEIAPIVGRKKKQKKEKKSTVAASPAPSRPASPPIPSNSKGQHNIQRTAQQDNDGKAHTSNTQTAAKSNSGRASRSDSTSEAKVQPQQKSRSEDQGSTTVQNFVSPAQIDTSIKLNESTKTTVLTPDVVPTPAESKQQLLEPQGDEDLGDIPSISDIWKNYVQEEPSIRSSSFFSNHLGYLQPGDHSFDSGSIALPPTLKSIVSKEDEEQLNAFKPVRKHVNGQSVLLTPNGDCLLGLTAKQQDSFLEYQDRVRAASHQPTAFLAPRHAPASGFSLVKNRAVPNGIPSFFPSGPDNYPSDPVGKMHREEAISCINQHVLPSLNGSYQSAGANANFTKNVNLQQLAPWIYSSAETDEQRRMFASRAAEEFGGGVAAPFDRNYGYDSPDGGPSPAIGSTPLMTVDEAESAWNLAKKQHETIEKKFRQLQMKNRRLAEV